MKKIVLVLVAAFVLSLIPCAVAAEGDVGATLDITYEYDNNSGNVLIKADFVDITAEEGIIVVEYDIKYDPSEIELVNTKRTCPDRWDSLIESGAIEDLSYQSANGVFSWIIVVGSIGEGATGDHELGIELEFKPLKKQESEIKFEYVNLLTEVIEDGMTLDFLYISSSSATIKVDFAEPSTPEIDKSDVSIPNNESVLGTSSSVDTTSTESSTGSTPSTDNAPQGGTISMPQIESVEESNTSEDGNGNGWILWVVLSVCAIGAVAACVFFVVKSKRGK